MDVWINICCYVCNVSEMLIAWYTRYLLILICDAGFLTTSMKKASDFFKEKQDADFSYYILVVCGWLAPPHTFTVAAMKAVNVARLNAYCELNKQRCPALYVMEDGFDAVTCCR